MVLRSYYSGSKVITPDPKFFSGSKNIIPDPKFLLWIQGFYFRFKDPIQFNIPKLKFEHVTASSPFNMAAAQGEELGELTFSSFSIWSLN